jgi:HEAT repeat protein
MKKRIDHLLNRIRKKDIQATLELGAIKNPEAIAPLMKALGDENEWVRNYVSLALQNMSNPAITELLLYELDNEDQTRRLHALETLQLIGDPACLYGVKKYLSDSNPVIANKALKLVSKLEKTS